MKHGIKHFIFHSLFLLIILIPFGVFGDIIVVDDLTKNTEFNNYNRGTKLFGDRCDHTNECGFPGSECDKNRKRCECQEEVPVTNHIDKCGKSAAINEKCFFNEQCEAIDFRTECRNERCVCRIDLMLTVQNKDGTLNCITRF